ncbi:hypothetical protein LDENG_00111070 [Lucifuga dentata]|nr:hypothetical protein LDENG_00111070 [Lucifuga dentata]
MAEAVQRIYFCLLLLTSITQGFQDIKVFHDKIKEAVVGQNVTLPCLAKNKTGFQIISTEWSKKDKITTKLALYVQDLGISRFRPNVNIQIQKNDSDKLVGSYLQLQEVDKSDSGVYICGITAFPQGSIRRETELKVKDVPKVMCDMNSTFAVNDGENVTIHCTPLSGAQYRWTQVLLQRRLNLM